LEKKIWGLENSQNSFEETFGATFGTLPATFFIANADIGEREEYRID
jgi:hypothetical protein